MSKKSDYKRYGFIPQRQKGLLLMRLRNRSGNLTSNDLRQVAQLAEEFGTGEIHVTMRQGMEIAGVPENRFEEALQAIQDAGLSHAVCGARIRPVVSCPGDSTCPYGLLSTRKLGDLLDEQFVGRDLPAKTKFAVSGCANACTKPQTHDVGFRGAVQPTVHDELCIACGVCMRRCPAKAIELPEAKCLIDREKCLSCGVCIRVCPKQAIQVARRGYHVYVGGKGGRLTREGFMIATFVEEESVVPCLEAILTAYNDLSLPGQRLAAVIDAVGQENFTQKAHEIWAR